MRNCSLWADGWDQPMGCLFGWKIWPLFITTAIAKATNDGSRKSLIQKRFPVYKSYFTTLISILSCLGRKRFLSSTYGSKRKFLLCSVFVVYCKSGEAYHRNRSGKPICIEQEFSALMATKTHIHTCTTFCTLLIHLFIQPQRAALIRIERDPPYCLEAHFGVQAGPVIQGVVMEWWKF